MEKLNSILIQEIALPLSKVLHTENRAQKDGYPTITRMTEEIPELGLEITMLFEEKIKSALRELEDIEKAERQRKGALLNILKKKTSD